MFPWAIDKIETDQKFLKGAAVIPRLKASVKGVSKNNRRLGRGRRGRRTISQRPRSSWAEKYPFSRVEQGSREER